MGPHLTKQQQEEAIDRYLKGESSRSIATSLGCEKSTIHRLIKRNNIETQREPCINLTLGQQDIIIARYQAGELAISLAKEFGVTGPAVNNMLKRREIPKHDLSYVRKTSKGCVMNENAFDELTPDSAYWIGFLMADGSISRKNRISLALQARDLGHVHKFRDFLSSNNKIGYRESTNSHSLQVYSAPMCEKLAEYGLVPNKTFTTKAPEFLVYDRDFWRGVVDGDGHIALVHKSSYFHKGNRYWSKPADVVALKLVGSENLMHQFHEYVKDVVPTYTGSVKPEKPIFNVATGGNTAKTLIDILYTNASTVLDRKAEVARQILSS